jgi:hypothetical protein
MVCRLIVRVWSPKAKRRGSYVSARPFRSWQAESMVVWKQDALEAVYGEHRGRIGIGKFNVLEGSV